MMLSKKLKPGQDDNDDDLDGDDKKKGKKKQGSKVEKDFKISDMDETWENEDDLDTDTDEDDNEGGKKKKKSEDSDDDDMAKKKSNKKKRSKEDVENEAFEDSDDGEGEGREVDYMSDESSEDEEIVEAAHDIAGVDQDEGLSKMLDSDESDEEDQEKESKEDEDEKTEEKKDAKSRSGSPTPEASDEKASRAEKRKAMVDRVLDGNGETNAAKRGRFEGSPATVQPALGSIEASFEEDVRRYLARKPMMTKEILKKMRQKRPDMSNDELMPLLVNVLKRIKPNKKKSRGVMYLSL